MTVAAFFTGLALLMLLHTKGKIFERTDLQLLIYWIPALLLVARLSRWVPANRPLPRVAWPLASLSIALILFLFASIIRHKWFYYLHWLPQASGKVFFQSTAVWFVVLTLALLPLFLTRNRHTARLLMLTLLTSQIAAFGRFLYKTGGDVLARDDHPSFVFRLWQFSETFPQLSTYNPYWNGGLAEHMHVVTGTLAPGILLWPLWTFGSVTEVYTLGIGLIYLVIVPLVAAWSVRAVNGDRIAQWTAGLLTLGVSQHFFLWLMQYGTVGANLVAATVIPVGALLYRVICLNRTTWRTGLGLIVSVAILLLYPPGALMAIPIALTLLLHVRRWNLNKIRFLAICAACVILLHARTILLFIMKDHVLHFVYAGSSPTADGHPATVLPWTEIKEGWRYLLAHLREGHPLLLIFGIAGIGFAPRRAIRTWYFPILLGFALITGWGKYATPDLELGRMSIPLMFAAVIPTALTVSTLLRTSWIHAAVPRAAIVSLLILTGLNVYRLYDRQGFARYHSLMPETTAMSNWIKEAVPQNGRVLFAGSTVHAYGGGHVAFMPMFADREMMACDYYHFGPKHVEYDYPPRRFRETEDAMLFFMDVYSVSTIITHHEAWKCYFRAHNDRYEEVTPLGESDLAFFLIRREPSIFLANSGTLSAHFNRIDLTVANAHEDAVIGYNWAEGLRVNAPAELFPYHAGHDVTLIGIRPNGETNLAIRYRSWL